jgi:hypothetical protein
MFWLSLDLHHGQLKIAGIYISRLDFVWKKKKWLGLVLLSCMNRKQYALIKSPANRFPFSFFNFDIFFILLVHHDVWLHMKKKSLTHKWLGICPKHPKLFFQFSIIGKMWLLFHVNYILPLKFIFAYFCRNINKM